MNVGFFGIQYSFGLQQSAINPIYDFLGAAPDEIPLLNLAGPVTGLIIQPIIGALSDKTWHPRFGRRKPYFFIGALFCSICLFLYPFSSTLWMAVGLLWILDAANNTAMEPYRALIADKLPPGQHATGFLTQSFFTGLGITLANVSLFIFQKNITGEHGKIPYWVFASFFLGSICSITSVLWSIYKTPEIPPTDEELRVLKANKGGILEPIKEIFMPLNICQKLCGNWHWCICSNGMPCFVIGKMHLKVLRNLFGKHRLYLINLYMKKQLVGRAIVNGWYNIVTFLSAFALVGFARRYSPKLVHTVCLIMAGIGLLIFPHIENKYLLFAPMTGFGIAWASMMGVPYLMVVNKIPKEKYGVYMGIINMMIVIPMILQNITFGYVHKHFLYNDPGKAITFAGVFLLLAALATMLIKANKPTAELDVVVNMSGAH